MSREEKSGFKAEIGMDAGSRSSNPVSNKKADLDSSLKTDKKQSEKSPAEIDHRKSSPSIDNYDDDFEDQIDEEIERDDIIENSQIMGQSKNFDSHAITVSQSLGIDPSVDSLALEDYDHIEPVEKLK